MGGVSMPYTRTVLAVHGAAPCLREKTCHLKRSSPYLAGSITVSESVAKPCETTTHPIKETDSPSVLCIKSSNTVIVVHGRSKLVVEDMMHHEYKANLWKSWGLPSSTVLTRWAHIHRGFGLIY